MKMPSGTMTKSFCQVKEMFFDRATVINAVNAATRKSLNHIGGLISKVARNSIKRAKGPSSPGQPPHSHTGLLKRFIYYGYDKQNESVIIGPCLINRGTDAPHVLEHGGPGTQKHGSFRLVRHPRYKARPFMSPAFESQKGKIKKILKDSIRS